MADTGNIERTLQNRQRCVVKPGIKRQHGLRLPLYRALCLAQRLRSQFMLDQRLCIAWKTQRSILEGT